jgi:alkanesulfonate monooxygenase SsuD/methylene tetrahydromethanopterin reductase-like flavin-dependent oxidoreductase (luciferase family)
MNQVMNQRTLKVGISTPWDLASLSPQDQRSRLGLIADSGIDHVFTADHVSFHDGSGIDGPVRLAALGGLEPRLDLYLGVYLLALRHPLVAARQIATLAELAPGRLTVGVGVGGEDRHEIEVCGIDPKTRGRRTDAALVALRGLLDGETVDGDGEFFDFKDGRIRPTPKPSVPLIVGGRSNAALERAGRFGDGWLAAWCSPRRFREATEIIEAAAAGRTVQWDHGLQIWLGVGTDPDDGRGYVAEAMTKFYKLDFELFAKYTPMGTAEQIAEFLQPFVEAGATTLNLTPCGANPELEVETVAQVKELLS